MERDRVTILDEGMSQSRLVMEAKPYSDGTGRFVRWFHEERSEWISTHNSRAGEQPTTSKLGSGSTATTQNDDGGGDKVETESTPDLTRQQSIQSEETEDHEGRGPDVARPSALDPILRHMLVREYHVEVNRDDIVWQMSTRKGRFHTLLDSLDTGFGPGTYRLQVNPRHYVIGVTKQLVKVVCVDSWTEDDWLNYVGVWLAQR